MVVLSHFKKGCKCKYKVAAGPVQVFVQILVQWPICLLCAVAAAAAAHLWALVLLHYMEN